MEVNLWIDKIEREMKDNFAELYPIIKPTVILEKALSSNLRETFPSIEHFHETYNMDCNAALIRLVKSGVPPTGEHLAAAAAAAIGLMSASAVAECVQNFITAMYLLKLNMVAVDQVHPLLSDLSSSLKKLSISPPDFEENIKMSESIGRLAKMGVADEFD